MSNALSEIDAILAKPQGGNPSNNAELRNQQAALAEIDKIVSPQQGFFSRVGDDLANVGKAWNAGNFYSKGGWNAIAKNIMNGGSPEEREKLYQQYLAFEAQNPMPENKSWVGSVVNGVANLAPLTIDMIPEAVAVAGATGAVGAAGGAAFGGVGAIPAGIASAKAGATASMIEQSYKVGVADIYTSLRKDGVDDETAKTWAIYAGIPYGALEYFGKAIAPIQRRLLGGKALKELIDKVTDKKIKNKILNAAVKYGADVALTGTAESAVEGAQGGVVETARQGAKGDGYSPAGILSAGWDEATAAAPAMYGMAALGVAGEGVAGTAARRRARDVEKIKNAVEQGKKLIEESGDSKPAETEKPAPKPDEAEIEETEIGRRTTLDVDADVDDTAKAAENAYAPQGAVIVPKGTPLGAIFSTPDGRVYRNVDGVPAPAVIDLDDAQPTAAEQALYQQELQEELARLNAEYDKVLKPAEKPASAQYAPQPTQKAEDTYAAGLFMDRLQNDPFNVPQGVPPNIDMSLARLAKMREDLREAQARKAAEEAKKAEAEQNADQDLEAYEAEKEFEAAKARTRKTYRRLTESESLLKKEQKEARKIIDAIPDEDSARKLATIKGYELDVLDDKDLDYALSHGEEWAQEEIERRERKREEESHDTLLDVMARNGYRLPTPNAIKRFGGSGDLYGEIKDLHDSLYKAGGKGRHYLQKFFRNQFVSVDDLTEVLNGEEGFSFSGSDDFLRTLGENFSGATITRSRYSIATDSESKKSKTSNVAKIAKAVDTIKRQFYRNAQRTASVEVVSSAELARRTGHSNARAAANGNEILIAGDKMKSPKQAAQILLHEYVGHFGLKRLLGKDFAPFVAYVRNKYKGTAEWERLKDTGYKGEDEIAEEMIAHLAEFRELSDPSMWRRLTARVQRALKNDGMSDAYAKLLDEDTLKAAVRLSRQWAKGDLAVNSKGKWKVLESTRAGRNIPDKDEGYRYSLQPSEGKTRAKLEAEHFGPTARNGDFDLNNINLADYEGIDTKDWDNGMWGASWTINTDIEYALNNPKEFPEVGDWLLSIGGEYLWNEESPEISTQTLKDILASRELAKLARAGYKTGVGQILAGILAQPTATKEVRELAAKRMKTLDLFEYTAGKLIEFNWTDQAIIDDFVRGNAKKMSDAVGLWYDYVDRFGGDIIPSDIADKIIKWADGIGATGAYTLEEAFKKNLFNDSDKLKCVKIAPISIAAQGKNGAATTAAINDELMRRSDEYVWDARMHIYDAVNDGNFDGNVALLKPILRRMASLDERFLDVTAKVIGELAGLRVKDDAGYKAWSGDFSKRRPPQDLRDVAYYDAIDRNAKEDAKAIVAERMKESGYRESPELMHTSRAQNISSFIFDDELAKKNGEGVKAYGHGAYMTESAGTTKYYREQFSDANADDLEIEINGKWRELTVPELRAVYIRLLCKSEKEAEKLIHSAKWSDEGYVKNNTYAALVHTKNKKLRLVAGGKPRTYNIAWNLTPEETLNLDEPFSGQNPEVQKKLLKFDRALTRKLGKTEFHRQLFNNLSTPKIPSDFSTMKNVVEALEKDLDDDAEASRVLTNFGIRGSKFANRQTRNKDGKKEYNYISFEGGSALKLRESITRDEEGRIVPPSERFNPDNKNWNFSLDDAPLTEKEKKNIEVFNRNIQNGSARLDISENDAYKQSGLNCNRILVRKSVIEQAEKLGIDTDKIPYELLRPVAIPRENQQIKQIRILTSLKGKQDRSVCFQGSVDKGNIAIIDDILGYRAEGVTELLNEDVRYINEEKARHLRESRQLHVKTPDASVRPDEPSLSQASIYSRPSQAKYSKKLEAAMDEAEERFDGKKDKVVYSLRQMGLDVTEDKREEKNSQYIDVHLDNGSTIYVRVSNHPAKTRIDVSIEKDWKAGTRFICEQADRGDWGTSTNPNWQGDARWSFSLEEEGEKPYDGRFGKAARKYQRLRTRKQKELGKAIEYDQLPELTSDAEFEKEVGMTKKEFANLMKERDEYGAEISHHYRQWAQRTKQTLVDRFNPIKIVERFMNGGDLFGAEKSAYKALFTAGNMDEVMFNALYVGLPKYDRKKGRFVTRPGSKPLLHYFDKVKGAAYKNFENYAKAVAMLEHYKRAHNLENISDAYKYADSKEFYEMAGFEKEQAKKWMEEATADSKETVRALQEFFKANREFMVETGLASREQAKALNSFEYYLPMLRELNDNDAIISSDSGGFKSRGFSGRSSGVKEFIGSKLKTKNVLESIIERSASLYANGYKNIAMQRSVQMLSEFGLARHAAKASERVTARISQAKHALEKAGVKVGDIMDDSELIPLEAFHIISSADEKIKDNIVSVRSNGRLIFYHIDDPELLVALKSLGQEQLNLITRGFLAAKRAMTWGVTKLPAFAVRNFLRDTGANAVLLGNNPAKAAENFVKAIKDTPQMQNIRMAGLGGAAWYPVSASGATIDFGDGAWKRTQRIGKYLMTPLRAYDRILQASEQANRITAYDAAIAEGLSEAEAAWRAADVLNFGMRGSGVYTGKNYFTKSGMEILSWLIRVSPFVNAGIQGLFKAYREIGLEQGAFNAKDEFGKRAKMRELAKALNMSLMTRGALLAALSVAYSIYANNSTDDDGEDWYSKLPDDEKLNYWIFHVGGNKLLRFPKPFEIGYMFSTIPSALTDAFLAENPETSKILWKGLVDQMRFDLTSNPIINLTKENLRNKTSFAGMPVVENSDLRLPAQMQYSADTSATAKALSIIPSMLPMLEKSWLASPARVQNILNNFFGGMTQYGTYATDAILQSFTDIEQPTSRYARISPITRAYDWAMRDTKTMRVKNSEKFYELKERVDELYASARMYRQTGQLEKLATLVEEHKAELGNYDLINAVNTRLREIATKRRKLGETKTYSTEMIALDDRLIAERNQILEKVDVLLDRLNKGEFRPRDFNEIMGRINRAGADKKDSQKARNLMRLLERK